MLRLASAVQLLQVPFKCWVVSKAHVSAKPARTPTSSMVSYPRDGSNHSGFGTIPGWEREATVGLGQLWLNLMARRDS